MGIRKLASEMSSAEKNGKEKNGAKESAAAAAAKESKSSAESKSSSASEQLNLRVIGQDGDVIQFKIKNNTPFRKLMSVYCDRLKLVQNNIRFVFDGNRIHDADTPATFDMVDDDAIEVFTQQTGGGEGAPSSWGRARPSLSRSRRRR